jgi:hypothetical protein
MATSDRVPVEALEELITQLPGIERCRIAVNDLGLIEEVHVLASDRRPAKQTVRDIESALAAAYSIRIDHKRISIAQVRGVRGADGWSRPSLHRYGMQLDPVEGRMVAEVEVLTLEDGAEPVVGRREARYLPSHQVWTVAEAALNALQQIPETPGPLALRDVGTWDLAGRSWIAVAVGYVSERGREQVACGTAVMLGDPHRAAAEATIDACEKVVNHHRDGRG